MKQRIWELDVLKGINLLWMLVIHFLYDITWLFPLLEWSEPAWYRLLVRLCGVLFVLISGICVTLGKRCLHRGLAVLGCGLVISLVTAGLAFGGLTDGSIIIYFGVLHCLGCGMLLWPLFRKCPGWLLAVLGGLLFLAGKYLQTRTVDTCWLVPLGVLPRSFASSDYFPLVEHLGIFLCGAGAGRYLYRKKASLFPAVRQSRPLRFFTFCGRHSLPIYMLHQPALALIAAICFAALS